MQIKLKVLWAKNFLGLSIDRVNNSYVNPVTNYYFWPKTEAWEQLKLELDFKPWIYDKEQQNLLNSAAEVMNFWQHERNSATLQDAKKAFRNINFININI